MNHPSFMALDAHALVPDSQIAVHLEGCAACASHIERLHEVPPLPLAVVRETAKPLKAPRRFTVTRYVLAAAVAAAVVVVMARKPLPPEVITPKGGRPAVQLWVKREMTVRTWAGEPVHPGESVRFEIAPGGYSHLSVLELSPTPHVIYAVALTAGASTTLTPAWALDAQGDNEDLAVVLTRQPLATDVLNTAARCQHDEEQWCERFTLQKKTKEAP